MIFSYHVTSQMEFSIRELEILGACSFVHYDRKCKMASETSGNSYPGQPNGLIVMLKNSILSDKIGRRVMAQDEIDLLSKVLEVSGYLPKVDAEMKLVIEGLRTRLFKTHQAITVEWNRLNQEAKDQSNAEAMLEWLWANCRIVHYPSGNFYPLEHAPLAQKNMRPQIEAAARSTE